MPLPNLGCQTCKLRRVKCDGREPVCLRCTKSRRTCQRDLTTHGASVIHSENAYASGQHKRPRGPRSTIPTVTTKEQVSIPRSLSVDLETRALSSYYYSYLQYTNSPPDVVRVVLDGVLPLWRSHPGFELVRLSATVIALALFSRTQHHAQAAVEASRKYSHLLCAMRKSLAFPAEQNIDAYLVAISLMARYEDIVHHSVSSPKDQPFVDTLRSSLHHDGAIELLKFWKACSKHSLTLSTDIVKLTRRGVIRSALMRNYVLSSCILNGADFGERGLGLEYDRLCIRVVLARGQLKSICSSNNAEINEMSVIAAAYSVACEAQEINLALENLRACCSGPMSLQVLTNKAVQLPHACDSPSIDEDFPCTVFKCHVLAMKMLAISTRIEAFELYSACLGGSVEEYLPAREARSDICITAQALIYTLHNSLRKPVISLSAHADSTSPLDGRLSMFQMDRLVWPLTIASAIKEIDSRRNKFFKAHLASIGGAMGIGVLQCANSEEWMRL